MSSEPLVNIPNRRILDKHFVSDIVKAPVKEYAISAGSKPGDNVMGTLLCVDVKTSDNDIHNLVIKSALPMTGVIDRNTLNNSKLIAATKAFAREIEYYDKIRPIFQNAWKGKEDKLAVFTRPKIYSCLHNPDRKGLDDYVILEDLRPLGYKMVNKFNGLNYEEMTAALKSLAILHATSYCLLNGNDRLSEQLRAIQKDPNSMANIHGWDRFLIKGADQGEFFDGILSNMIDLIREDGKIELAKKIQDISKDAFDQILMKLWENTTDQGKYFRVLIHGDIWTNNLLVKRGPDGKSLEDMALIDFQYIHFGNIYEDLQYFIFTSTIAEFRQAHLKSCLSVYFREFANVVTELHSSMPHNFTEESLVATFHETLNFGFIYNILAIPYQIGLPAPPPSPMTPIEVNFNADKPEFFSPVKKEESKDDHNDQPDFGKILKDQLFDLRNSARNSPIAMQRLYEMIEEMIELQLIQ